MNGLLSQCRCLTARALICVLLLVYVMSGLSQRVLAQSDEVVIRIEVEDRNEDTIDRAAREALQIALLKRSGDRAVLQHPAVETVLASARTQLSLYQFERVGGMTRFVAQIDHAVIENLIKAANGTLWAEARPPILLWLVIDDLTGRRFGNTAEELTLWERLSVAFDDLGVNLRRPLYDLTDAVLVSPDGLWRRDFGPIVEASERYGMNHLLLGRLVRLSNGRYIGEWVYRDVSVERAVSITADSLETLIDPGVTLAMSEMRRQYAVALTTDTETQALRIRVHNVVSRDDYRAVTAAMRGIQTLDHVRPVAVQGETLTLELQGVSDAETLTRLMASRTDLVWVSSDPGSDEGLVLAWQAP